MTSTEQRLADAIEVWEHGRDITAEVAASLTRCTCDHPETRCDNCRIELIGEFADGIPHVRIPVALGETARAWKRANWREMHGYGYGDTPAVPADLHDRLRAVIDAGGDCPLVWVTYGDRKPLGYVEAFHGGIRFSG